MSAKIRPAPGSHPRSQPIGPPIRSTAGNAWLAAYAPAKAALDWTFGLVLLVLFAPVIGTAAALVRLTSAGPAFYTQVRVGRGGRTFRIYKLRTMYHDCERVSGARWSQPGDRRVTRVGAILRATHIDELPQLINVLRGEMSLVGPRPERPEFIPMLAEAIPYYTDRLQVRPGVTGLAQLRQSADTDLESVRRKLAYDLHYIAVIGPWLDLRLTACTALKMFGLPLSGVLRLAGVPGSADLTPRPEKKVSVVVMPGAV
jgi:lipopolysaccharide/colanic/teichoic acid biosynthesis glycosyltransferase